MERKQYNAIIFVLGSLAAIGPLSIDMYLPGFPAMAADLSTDIAHVGLSLTSFFVGVSIGHIMYGPIMDRYGRKKPMLLGLVVFVLASLGCAFCRSISALIALRFFLALGGCAGMVGSRAIVRDLFSGSEVARVLSAVVMVFGVAPVIAPTVGGFVVKVFGWRYIFVILAVIGVCVFVALGRFFQESKGADASISLHPKSVALEYLGLFREPVFVIYALASAASVGGFFAYITGSAFVYMELLGFTETQFGWMYAVNAVGLVAGSQINRLWLKRESSERILLKVTAAQFCAITALILWPLNGFGSRMGLMGLIFCYISLAGFVNPNSMALALQPFTRNAGSASAMLGSIQLVAGALASWVMSLIYNGTALPMTGVMAVCTTVSLIIMAAGMLLMKKMPPAPGH